jgi:hypothetical protein
MARKVRQIAATFDLSASPSADNQSMLSAAIGPLYRPDHTRLNVDLTLPL